MRSLCLRAFWVPMLGSLLSCGGGGGGGGASDNPSGDQAVSVRTIEFAQSGPVQVYVGQTYVNPVLNLEQIGYPGYQSSDENVALVWSGRVTPIAEGQVTITANRTQSHAQGSYELIVREPAVISAWVGPDDALVEIDEGVVGAEFASAGEWQCAIPPLAECGAAVQPISYPRTLVDTNLTLTNATYYSLNRDGVEAAHLMSVDRPIRRHHFTLTSFKDRLWLVGGGFHSLLTTDIWSTPDGVRWVRESVSPPFGPRKDHQVVVYQGQLWLIAGKSTYSGGERADVWRSADGVNWQQVTDSAAFGPRSRHQLQVFGNRLWLFGGRNQTSNLNDIWSSIDGVTWHREVESAAFPASDGNQVTQFNEKLWLVDDDRSFVIWSSDDGVNWHSSTTDFPPFSGNQQFQVKDDMLWLFDCDRNGGSNDAVWRTRDGLRWEQVMAQARFPRREGCRIAQLDGKFWFIGGLSSGDRGLNPYWSDDGVNWLTRSREQVYGLTNVDVVSRAGRLWIMEGSTYGTGNDARIWTSANGIYWRKIHQKATPLWLSWFKDDAQWLTLRDQFWFVSGRNGSFVTSSVDGVEWSVGQRVPFPDRRDYQVVAFADKIYVIGGFDGASRNDVWVYDPDGGWSHPSLAAAFSPRRDHQVVEFNNKLWLVGGHEYRDGAYFYTNDVWSSDDGVSWNLELARAPFAARANHRLAVFNGRLWLIGGVSADAAFKDVWSSADGVNWHEHSTPPFSPRSGFGLIEHQNLLLVIGGGGVFGSDIWSTQDGENWRKAIWEEFYLP